jgi:twitching motility protein PilT
MSAVMQQRMPARDEETTQVDLQTMKPDAKALACLPEELCRQHLIVPLRIDGETLTVAATGPMEEGLRMQLARASGRTLVVRAAPMLQLITVVGEWYRSVSPSNSEEVAPTPVAPVAQVVEQPAASTVKVVGEVLSLDALLAEMMARQASDLHITVGLPPLMRVHGELTPFSGPALTPQQTEALVLPILSPRQREQYGSHQEMDLSHSVAGTGRFRVNVFRQRGSVGAIFRSIPMQVPTLESLNLPDVVQQLTTLPRGLVLVTGQTGSGKSTTLAAMINAINHTRRTHIMTVEDPIEFLHPAHLAEINQREVGADTESFVAALRHVLRQDPDVILIGEMRDLETIAAAVTAAETGHLVFATLHTNSAAQTIDRIIDVFPSSQQGQIRSQLANVLEAILTQVLVPTVEGTGRRCAMEILLANTAVRSLIRDAKIHQIPNIIEVSGKLGMQTLDQALKQLVMDKQVTLEQALAKSSSPEDFKRLLAMG